MTTFLMDLFANFMVITNRGAHVEEVGAGIQFDECKLTFCQAKSQLA